MFLKALIAVCIFHFVSGQIDRLEAECHILQSLDDLQTRLTAAESRIDDQNTEISTLQNSLATAETEISTLQTSLGNADTRIIQQYMQIASLRTSQTASETEITTLQTSMATVETEITTLQTSLTTAETEITTLQTSLVTAKTEIATLQTSLTTAETEITTLQTSLTTTETKITTLQTSLATAETEIENLKTSLTESRVKPDVVFHVKDVDGEPTRDNVIKFMKVVANTDDVYDLTTGCFTAPRNGTYWFSAHICVTSAKQFSPSINVRGVLTSRSWLYYVDHAECGSVAAVSVLEAGDDVCLKSGPVQAASAIWRDARFQFSHFMGALIN